jgi:antirestriction protein ArdC
MNRWLTYRQALELSAQVPRGEHGTPVVFWKLRRLALSAESCPQEDDGAAPPDKVFPLLRAYTVFNVGQIDGLPETLCVPGTARWEPEAKGEELLLMSGARSSQGGARAGLDLTNNVR